MIAGMTTIWQFPMDVQIVLDLVRRVDALVLWFDRAHHGRRKDFEQLIRDHGQHLQHVVYILSPDAWTPSTFREPQLRALDQIKPAYVLQPDSDETFETFFEPDLQDFRASGRDMMMFGYDMPTQDNAWVPTQPKARHCKAFRWRPGLSFVPYRGFAMPTGLQSRFEACSHIQHFCCWTPEIQRSMLAKQTMPASQRAYWGQRRPPCSTP